MTNEEFDSCLLKERVQFKFIEAARLVLVHQIKIDDTLTMLGLHATDITRIKNVISMFEKAHENKNSY